MGWIRLTANQLALTSLYFREPATSAPLSGLWSPEEDRPLSAAEAANNSEQGSSEAAATASEKASQILDQTAAQLQEWFAGQRHDFDLPLAPQGTEFQQRVWHALLHIPFGKTWSYLDLALQLGDKNATRAVGSANGRNPISLIIPCHRVIGSNGKLTGYGGGIERKKWLLDFEAEQYQPVLF